MHRLSKIEIERLGPPSNFNISGTKYIYNDDTVVNRFHILFQEVGGGDDWYYMDRVSSQTVSRILCLDNYGGLSSFDRPFIEATDVIYHNLVHIEDTLDEHLVQDKASDIHLSSKTIIAILSRIFGPPLFDINQKLTVMPDEYPNKFIFFGFKYSNRIYLIRFCIVGNNRREETRYIDICLPFNEPRTIINEKAIYDTIDATGLEKFDREALEELTVANKL